METNNTKQAPEEMPLSPEEIKAIGEIDLGPAKHEVFLNKHYKKLIVGGIALAIVATAATAWYAHGETQKEEAGALVVKAVGTTVTDTTMSPKNYDPAALDEVLNDFAGTPSEETAMLLKALRELTDPANTDFSALVELSDKAANQTVQARACVALATRFAADGDTEKATMYWKKVIDMPRNAYTARAYVNLCDIAWNAGKVEQAADYLRQARAACPDSTLFAEGANNDIAVRSDLLESGVDAPEIVAPAEQPAADAPAAAPSTDDIFNTPAPVSPDAPAADDIFSTPATTTPATDAPALPSLSEDLSTLPASN